MKEDWFKKIESALSKEIDITQNNLNDLRKYKEINGITLDELSLSEEDDKIANQIYVFKNEIFVCHTLSQSMKMFNVSVERIKEILSFI